MRPLWYLTTCKQGAAMSSSKETTVGEATAEQWQEERRAEINKAAIFLRENGWSYPEALATILTWQPAQPKTNPEVGDLAPAVRIVSMIEHKGRLFAATPNAVFERGEDGVFRPAVFQQLPTATECADGK